MLTLFTYLLFRTGGRPAQPRKRISRAHQRLYAVLRYIDSVSVVGGLFGLTLVIVHSEFIFILLPTGLSMVVTFILARSYLTNIKALVATTIVALLYFGGVTGLELVTHHPGTSEIIVVTTSLAIAVMFAPLGVGALRLLDQRFHIRDDATSRTVEAFTAALREEIDLDSIRERLLEVVSKTLQPRYASMWPIVPAAQGALAEPHPTADVALVGMPPALASATTAAGTGGGAISSTDPLVAYSLKRTSPIEVERTQLDSPDVRGLSAQGAELALPLVSQGDVISLLALGLRLMAWNTHATTGVC